MALKYFVKAIDETQPVYKLGLLWGVYLATDVSPVAMGFFYDEHLAAAVCAMLNGELWNWPG